LALIVLGFPRITCSSPHGGERFHRTLCTARIPLDAARLSSSVRGTSGKRRHSSVRSSPHPATHFQHTTDRFRLPHRTFRRFCQHWSPSSHYPLAQSGPSTAEPGPIRAWEARQPRSTTIAAFLVQHRRTQLLSSYG
jgi:hypothetical protein